MRCVAVVVVVTVPGSFVCAFVNARCTGWICWHCVVGYSTNDTIFGTNLSRQQTGGRKPI